MCFRENNNGGSKRACKSDHVNAVNIFHDVNSILNTITNVGHPKARPGFIKAINIFRSENLALFTVASIHKSKQFKNINSETGSKLTENSRMRLQDSSNRSKDREIELINNKV